MFITFPRVGADVYEKQRNQTPETLECISSRIVFGSTAANSRSMIFGNEGVSMIARTIASKAYTSVRPNKQCK